MKTYLCVFCSFVFFSGAQTIGQCKQRFNDYLNFRGSLDHLVKFENDAFYLVNAQGKKEFAVYAAEIETLAVFFKGSSLEQQERLLHQKKTAKWNRQQLDSLKVTLRGTEERIAADLPLKGYRIALDPGHFSTSMTDARSEQKYLFFVPGAAQEQKDTVKIFESQLTFNTAHILKHRLEEKGAEVFMTRNQADFTSFNCTYQDWIKHHRKKTLDSLKRINAISVKKHAKLLKCNDYTLFWDFFRDYDLVNRANKINAFRPEVTAIIHYNVDEKNAPWKQHTQKNFSMTFIGGAFTADNLSKTESKINFLRLLLTDQLNRSELLSAKTVSNFNRILEIPIAKAPDADYLKDNCLITASPGVFCRNLALCRKINSPLVYGESLYQDNEKETRLLMRSDLDIYGIKANERVSKVASCYYEALFSFLKNN